MPLVRRLVRTYGTLDFAADKVKSTPVSSKGEFFSMPDRKPVFGAAILAALTVHAIASKRQQQHRHSFVGNQLRPC